jgi:phenylalanyl-tRNA synthetase alpha chain
MPIHLAPDQLRRDLSVRDLTDPEQGQHALQILVRAAAESLSSSWVTTLR